MTTRLCLVAFLAVLTWDAYNRNHFQTQLADHLRNPPRPGFEQPPVPTPPGYGPAYAAVGLAVVYALFAVVRPAVSWLRGQTTHDGPPA